MTYRGADPTAVMGRRIGAYIIDVVLLLIITFAVLVPLWQSKSVTAPSGTVTCGSDSSEFRSRPGAPEVNFCFESGNEVRYIPVGEEGQFTTTVALVSGGASFLMLIVLQGLVGGSPGKLMLGLRVVKENGENAGVLRCLVRTILLPIDASCCAIIGLLTAFNSKRHRRVGDMAASTMVIGRDDQDALVLARSGHTLPGRVDLAAQQWTNQNQPSSPATGSWDPSGGIHLPGDPMPSDPTAPSAWPSQPTPSDPTTPSAPTAPGPEGGPTWDPARNAYIQYDQTRGAWMQFDNGTQQWKPIDS
ncbi:MAG: RDD family protein [Aquihabitans sp.]